MKANLLLMGIGFFPWLSLALLLARYHPLASVLQFLPQAP